MDPFTNLAHPSKWVVHCKLIRNCQEVWRYASLNKNHQIKSFNSARSASTRDAHEVCWQRGLHLCSCESLCNIFSILQSTSSWLGWWVYLRNQRNNKTCHVSCSYVLLALLMISPFWVINSLPSRPPELELIKGFWWWLELSTRNMWSWRGGCDLQSVVPSKIETYVEIVFRLDVLICIILIWTSASRLWLLVINLLLPFCTVATADGFVLQQVPGSAWWKHSYFRHGFYEHKVNLWGCVRMEFAEVFMRVTL